MSASELRPEKRGPLAGIRVLDTTGVVVGPMATLILAEQGADVIKIEPPEGDLMRRLGGRPRKPGMSPKFLHFNRNKRSIALDLKSPEGREVMGRLAETADVFVSNMRPRALQSLGLTFEALSAKNPRIVHCTISGFATGGPYAGAPAYDTIIQGLSGVAACHAEVLGEPRFAPFVLTDHLVGIVAAQAICAALLGRERTGVGEAIEVPMFENAAAFVLCEHLDQRTFEAGGHMGDPRIMTPDARPLKTRDGYICVSANTDVQARAFFDAIGRPELKTDPRFVSVTARLANVRDYFAVRTAAMAERTTAEWVEILRRHDVPAMPYHTLHSLLDDPQLRGSGVLTDEVQKNQDGQEETMLGLRHPNRYSGTGVPESRLAPRFGEHGDEILAELGYGPDDRRRLGGRDADAAE
ncbi:CaiB/BaiF CoA transferase family protein [Rhodoplanes roseus]|uniref:Formyl-CoA transferase n=1 Tax=Rhodoplanes roseus TaxID=29409 RepID=A0A327KY45_9BRAD|nr:CoA transferase [Rhodoplanes roseus]RAI42092.1 formyl-CoA transferase [Rhodoplanes roseus]